VNGANNVQFADQMRWAMYLKTGLIEGRWGMGDWFAGDDENKIDQ